MSNIFRLQNNVPEVYVEESRDFQLFCRLYDSVVGGEHYLINSLKYASSTAECNERLLELLQTKLGFFTKTQLTAQELRLILQAYPYIIQHKGSRTAIDYVIALFRRLTYTGASSILRYEFTDDCKLLITFDRAIPTDTFLHELLRYVLPSGYIIEYDVMIDQELSSIIYPVDTVTIQISSTGSTYNVSEARTDSDYSIDLRTGIQKVDEYETMGAIVGLSQVQKENEGETT